MPRRKERTRNLWHIPDEMIHEIKSEIAAGVPWNSGSARFRLDLKVIVFGGADYGISRICRIFGEVNSDAVRELLWRELGPEIVAQHARFRPCSRPQGFWTYDVSDMRDGESKHEYLQRRDLYTGKEKEILDKFGEIKFVRISSGTLGRCSECWLRAREIASEIGFEIPPLERPDDVFWVPAKLVEGCQGCPHKLGGSYPGIFTAVHCG